MSPSLVELSHVSKTYGSGHFTVRALRDVSLSVEEGKTVAIVGESGSGKTTIGRIVLGIEAASEGEVRLNGQVTGPDRSLAQRRTIQVVQQNPYLTLNPGRTIGQTIGYPLGLHFGLTGKQARVRIGELLDLVGIPADLIDRRPGNLSGGQRQRIALARALACEPRALVLDEPTSALDVSVQARVLRLLADLQAQLGLTYLFITHDLAIAKKLSSTVAVIYRGKLVEHGAAETVLSTPAHPYTANLLASVPVTTEEEEKLKPVVDWREDTAELEFLPTGCAFRGHCWRSLPACSVTPLLRPIRPGISAACFNPIGSLSPPANVSGEEA